MTRKHFALLATALGNALADAEQVSHNDAMGAALAIAHVASALEAESATFDRRRFDEQVNNRRMARKAFAERIA